MFRLLDSQFELLDYVGFVSHLFCKQRLPGMMSDCVHALEASPLRPEECMLPNSCL